jgi:hypothetical protein
MFENDYFAFNPLSEDPNKRGNFPILQQLVDVTPGAMVAGVATVDIDSKFGKGKGEVFGAYSLNSRVDVNVVMSVSVVEHATDAGKLTITLEASDAASTVDVGTIKLILVGKVLPVNV